MLAGGILVTASAVAARQAPSLSERIAPYVDGRRAADPRDDLGVPVDAPLALRLLVPVLAPLRLRLPSSLVSDAALEARLAAAGDGMPAAAFRMHQLLWGLAGSASALAAVLALAVAGRPVRPAAALLLIGVGGVLGVLLRDRRLTAAVRRRREAVEAGLPVVADLLALAVASGESPAAALARVARVAHGPLAQECGRAVLDARAGQGLVASLEAMARRVDVPAVSRFVDGVAIAVQRGTPLGDVLRAQAGDARAEQHRALLEVAGRKELLMLVPVVFLVLPTVVLVALFPAISSLAVLGSGPNPRRSLCSPVFSPVPAAVPVPATVAMCPAGSSSP
jgi:tight adherence protein C